MTDGSDLSLATRLFLKTYPWRRIDPVPFQPLKRPLAESRVALVSSAGFTLAQQPPFDASIRGGDTSVREIPRDVDVSVLKSSHRSQAFDSSGMLEDPNLAFPLDRLRELRRLGWIGSLAPRHLSFMGSITAPGRLIKQTAPEAVAKLVEDEVDVALLVPV